MAPTIVGGYDVRRVMVDQGSAAEIMYPDLIKGLGLKWWFESAGFQRWLESAWVSKVV